ncbi:uncharacterized protein LOC118456031 [Neolamprologus brichardi]|uniref:uncharacterized protein LOC118456031 n=1 Tax=Neolamprologus brichardi TaxID=32507 RepID=UPI001643A337|nr:uncharacterized protein LOC118456031 [Neolamprologus brichardi]
MRGLPATADKEVVRLPPPQREGLHLLGLGTVCPSGGRGTLTWDIELGLRLNLSGNISGSWRYIRSPHFLPVADALRHWCVGVLVVLGFWGWALMSAMDTRLREFLTERKVEEDAIKKLEDENIDETVIPLMTDSDLAKYIPKVGDRVSTVAFCRQLKKCLRIHLLTRTSPSRKESILSRLQQRLTGAEGMPSKKRLSQWAENTNAKRTVRRIEVGWMDFDEEKDGFKQVKSVSGGGTRHLSVDKNETVSNIKLMAENLFFPNGISKKPKSLSHYSTHIESSQMHVDASSTVDEFYFLYDQSKVKILRLYLCTRKKTQQQPQDVEADHAITQPSVVDLTDNERNQAADDLLVENINSEPSNHFLINDGASISGYLELNDTLPWDGLPNLQEAANRSSSEAEMVIKFNIV